MDGLIAAMREREALLILDNCEHVIESAAAFADRVLGECRRLRILATSREPVGITGEALWQVEPLAVPDGSAGEIESSPAIRLMRDRADAVRKDLGGDARTWSAMARICRALDGTPLAIELAAARLRSMTIEQLANRLDDRFRLLTSGSRTASPRHKTLRAVVDWSWELLTDAERLVLRRLSVFSGGASLEAAEQVCAAPAVPSSGEQGAVPQDEVLELLTSLAEKSLLRTEGQGALRYRMLGTIKEYTADRLTEAGESGLARQAHVGYFTELAESAEPHLRRAEQLAYRFSQRSQQGNPLLALVAPLERMLQAPGDFLSAWESVLDNEDPWVRALARLQLGKMRIMLGQGVLEAEADLELALAEFRALGERFGISFALSELAEQIAKRGDFAGACEHYEQATGVVSEVGATEDVIRLRTRQAMLYWLKGDQDASAAAVAEAERSADGVTWPYALVELALAKAELARWGGHAEEARRQLGVATTFLGDDAEQASIRAELHDVLGYLADDLGEARTHRVAAWQAASEAGLAPLIAQVIVGVADLAVRLGQYEQAARLLAASVGVRGQPDRSRPDAARVEQTAQRHLGEARFAEVTHESTQPSWAELVEATFALDGQRAAR